MSRDGLTLQNNASEHHEGTKCYLAVAMVNKARAVVSWRDPCQEKNHNKKTIKPNQTVFAA